MTTIKLNAKDRKEVNFNDFKTLLSTVGMGWYGIENWTRGDLDLFETKFEGFTVEPTNNNTMRIWDVNYDYSELYK